MVHAVIQETNTGAHPCSAGYRRDHRDWFGIKCDANQCVLGWATSEQEEGCDHHYIGGCQRATSQALEDPRWTRQSKASLISSPKEK